MARKSPEIRFSGFTKDWEQRKLGEVANIENGFAFKSKYFQDEPSKVIVLTPGNISIGGGFQSDKGRFYNASGTIPEKFIFHPGDIFVTMTDLTPTGQTLGLPAIVPDNGMIYLHNQRLGKITNYGFNDYFLFQTLKTERYHKHIVSTASGTTVKHSSPQKILDYNFSIPTIEEQINIAKMLNTLENTVTLLQRKVDTLKQFKKSFLQKMYPRKGLEIPVIRFTGLSGVWIYKPINEVADIVGGGTPKTGVKEYWGGDINWYSPTEIGQSVFVTESKRKITTSGLEKSSAKLLPANRTILFTSRAGIGDMAILKNAASTNQGFQSLVIKNRIDIYFLYTFGFEIKKNALKFSSGSTFLEISGKELGKIVLPIPSLVEQQKIGEFFRKLDGKIDLQENKLEELKKIKKSFSQKMFI